MPLSGAEAYLMPHSMTSDSEWLKEATAGHQKRPKAGLIKPIGSEHNSLQLPSGGHRCAYRHAVPSSGNDPHESPGTRSTHRFRGGRQVQIMPFFDVPGGSRRRCPIWQPLLRAGGTAQSVRTTLLPSRTRFRPAGSVPG